MKITVKFTPEEYTAIIEEYLRETMNIPEDLVLTSHYIGLGEYTFERLEDDE